MPAASGALATKGAVLADSPFTKSRRFVKVILKFPNWIVGENIVTSSTDNVVDLSGQFDDPSDYAQRLSFAKG